MTILSSILSWLFVTAGLLVSEIRRHRQSLFEELQLFYRVFVLKEDITLEDEA